MTFAQVQGQDRVKAALAGMVDADRVPHAILFHEDDGGGAFPLALAFLQYLFCAHRAGDSCGVCPTCNKIGKLIHPDVHFIFPTAAGSISLEYMDRFRPMALANPYFTTAGLQAAMGIEGRNSMIAVSEAKHLLDALSLSALEGGYRAVVVYLPEKMNQEAANRLLKMIEEPPRQTQFVLITHAPEKVLVTISSRCQRIRIAPEGPAAVPAFDEPELLDDLMDALLAKDLLAALGVADRMSALSSRESAKAFCKFAADAMRQLFLRQQGVTSLAADGGRYDAWAAGCRRTFPRQALDALGRAQSLIDRNVNMKILFTDLVNRLYLSI